MPKNLSFSIQAWSAWSCSKRNRSDWLNWSKECSFLASEEKQDFSKIPAMKRRRMSSLSKMALATALDCLENEVKQNPEHDIEPPRCIFTSQHGELNRTMKILHNIAVGDDISPTDFSLSVHNTAAGLFSIQTKNKQAITSIAAGDDSFAYALIEACTQLQRNPEQSVLVVYFDQPVTDLLPHKQQFPVESEAIALLLSSGNEISFSFNHKRTVAEKDLSLAQAFLRFYLSKQSKLEMQGTSQLWCWSKQ